MEDKYLERKKNIDTLIYDKHYKPLKFKELKFLLDVSDEDKDELKRIIDDLVKEGRITVSPKGKIMPISDGMIAGTFIGNAKGFGFVSVEGMDEDFFVPATEVHGAMHNDKVLIKVINDSSYNDSKSGAKHRKEATIVKVTERGFKTIVGTFEKSKTFGFVVPDNTKLSKDIFIDSRYTMGAVSGHKVVVEMLNYGSEDKKPEGRIVEILGHINDPGTDILSIVRAYDLPVEFSSDIMTFLETVPDEVLPNELEGRKDFRSLDTVTIDGEDAKDLDDAITLSRDGDNYKLGVHIADVSNYVREHSLLDEEALKRGTSVYLVDRVIPMLPHKLSNGICSLNQGTDRLTLSCVMTIDSTGEVLDYDITEGVINVNRRMSYTAVNKIIKDKDPDTIKEYEELVPMFNLMKELADILRKRRYKRGSIDFDFPETKITLNEAGKPIKIAPYERNDATDIIEDFMLMANETVAAHFYWQEVPFEYRIHEAPDPEKIERLSVLINNFGYYFKTSTDNIHPKEFQKLLKKIEGADEEALISRMTLRAMKQAKYSVECSGHFGLSAKFYCHFTSPIRRYPDLQIHRIIKESLHGRLNEKRISHYQSILPAVADSNSKRERVAEEAEREVVKLKMVQYMSDRIGEVFDGVISGMNAYGMYVELPNTIEGMVHVTNLTDDYYFYDEEKYAMIGKETKKEYLLGQKVKVKVIATDLMLKTIDFRIYRE